MGRKGLSVRMVRREGVGVRISSLYLRNKSAAPNVESGNVKCLEVWVGNKGGGEGVFQGFFADRLRW